MNRLPDASFINNINSSLTRNGVIDKTMLFEPPFTHIHDQGLLDIFDDAAATQVVSLIDRVNQNAGGCQLVMLLESLRQIKELINIKD